MLFPRWGCQQPHPAGSGAWRVDARLRVGGMTDDEARQLPVQLDAGTFRSFGSSTWMTDAGPIDVLGISETAAEARSHSMHWSTVVRISRSARSWRTSQRWATSLLRRSTHRARRIGRRFPSSVHSIGSTDVVSQGESGVVPGIPNHGSGKKPGSRPAIREGFRESGRGE